MHNITASPSIRAMTPMDIPIVASWMTTLPLWQRYSLTEEKAIRQFERALLRQDSIFVADCDNGQQRDQLCGFAWCVADGAFARSMYLRQIGVRQDQAKRGVGSALLDAAEQAARNGSGDLFLLVSDFNQKAQAFYQRHGYHQIGAVPGYILPDVTELLYWKQLSRQQ
ncbi:MAG: GNAT family N-acetyltransferase [Anaerolineae bacterium]